MSSISFKEPYPPAGPSSSRSAPSLKQRRVSLAVPSSARLVPAWNFRDDTSVEKHIAEGVLKGEPTATSSPDGELLDGEKKKIRRKWTPEETSALVEGCKLYGVGNWKTMLKDPNLKFDSRSAVDLKDRFRTYFPDAYKQHYPNAKTHLSSRVRSTLPDGTSLFEKTRGKKRRPFTVEEDEALKAGYERHGTVWATIVKDPAFLAQGRKSTDLRDRFRNAFPELYQAAGYKPRSSAKKKMGLGLGLGAGSGSAVGLATQDDQAVGRRTTGPIRRRRALTNEGLGAPQLARMGSQSVPESSTNSDDEDGAESEDDEDRKPAYSQSQQSSSSGLLHNHDMDMDVPPLDDFLSTSLLSDMPPWHASTDPSSHHHLPPWATPASVASPSTSHISGPDYFRHAAPISPVQRPTHPTTIGKSAWPSQDWLNSANPRLEQVGISISESSASSSFAGFSPVPSSPFSLSHGVFDRYDLPAPHQSWSVNDFISEVGPGDSHSTFSDPDSFAPPFRGFTHHSSYAGDLIFGARTHQPLAAGSGHAFGFGVGSGLGLMGAGLGVGVGGQRSFNGTGAHTPSIDEAALGAISLNDPSAESLDALLNMSTILDPAQSQPLDQLIHTEPEEMRLTPPGTPLPVERGRAPSAIHNRSISVPPAEHARLLAPSSIGIPTRPPLTPTRSMSLLEGQSHYDTQLAYPADEIPFLDMHYYTHGPGAFDGFTTHGGAGALDLAVLSGSGSSVGVGAGTMAGWQLKRQVPQTVSVGLPPYSFSALHPPPSSGQALGGQGGGLPGPARQTMHHRVQSAVSPQDLMLRPEDRRRMSWDGGPP